MQHTSTSTLHNNACMCATSHGTSYDPARMLSTNIGTLHLPPLHLYISLIRRRILHSTFYFPLFISTVRGIARYPATPLRHLVPRSSSQLRIYILIYFSSFVFVSLLLFRTHVDGRQVGRTDESGSEGKGR